jgi:F-type H+-transporting ATPase subunit c
MGKQKVWVFCLILALGCFWASWAFAAEAGLDSEVKKYIALACIGLGIAALGGGIGQGIAIKGGLEGIARNPEAQPKIFIAMIVGLALIESLVIYVLVVTFILLGKL